MDITELKSLATNSYSIEEWGKTLFKEYSKDDKFVSSSDYEKIISSICDEYGIQTPSQDEMDAMKNKLDSENDDGCFNQIVPYPFQDDDISFEEYCDKLQVILNIIILKLEN